MKGNEGWITLTVDAPPRGEEVYLVEALRRVGARMVEPVPGGGYMALFTQAATRSGGFLPRVRAAVRAATSLPDPELRIGRLEAASWARRWASELRPLPVGRRFFVVPEGWESQRHASGKSGSEAAPPSDRLALRLRAGTAFGTAEHPTTRLCLEALEGILTPECTLLDLGAGSGILSIGAALLGAERVLGLELDPEACREARSNAELNRVEEAVDIRELRVDASHGAAELLGKERFGVVVANLERPTLLAVLGFAAEATAGAGTLILSGVPRYEAEAPIAAAGEAGFVPLAQEVADGWWCGAFHRPGGDRAAG